MTWQFAHQSAVNLTITVLLSSARAVSNAALVYDCQGMSDVLVIPCTNRNARSTTIAPATGTTIRIAVIFTTRKVCQVIHTIANAMMAKGSHHCSR